MDNTIIFIGAGGALILLILVLAVKRKCSKSHKQQSPTQVILPKGFEVIPVTIEGNADVTKAHQLEVEDLDEDLDKVMIIDVSESNFIAPEERKKKQIKKSFGKFLAKETARIKEDEQKKASSKFAINANQQKDRINRQR